MCLLTFVPAGVMADLAALSNGTQLNDDGHGFAVVAADRLIVRRGMDAEPIIEAFAETRQQHPDGPALFHSRMGTHGERAIDNCHPFAVGGDNRTVLAHNGVLPSTVRPANGDRRSDTRITVEEFLPRFGSLRSRRARQRFERWMQPDNKAVLLTVDRRFRRRAYILNEASGIWDGGIWYSNDGYLPWQRTSWALAAGDGPWPGWDRSRWWGDDGAERCTYCGTILDITAPACDYCGSCVDCGRPPVDCFCYTPAVLDKRIRRARSR